MLETAEHRTTQRIIANHGWRQAQIVGLAWHKILLYPEFGDPEAMDHIPAGQLQVYLFTGWQDQIGRNDPIIRILKLPGPLLGDHLDDHRGGIDPADNPQRSGADISQDDHR